MNDSLQNLTTVRRDTYDGLCDSGFRSNKWLLALLIPGVVFLFVGLAIITDDYFVSALEIICERLDLSEDVAGATFMAAGSSTPEFFASLLGVFVTKDAVGVGTIVGSAVFNVLVIIGLSAALAGAVLKLDWRPLARDSFFYVISIILMFVFVMFSSRGEIKWWEGLILVLSYVVYVLFMAYGNKPYMKWAKTIKFCKRNPEGNDLEAQQPDGELGEIRATCQESQPIDAVIASNPVLTDDKPNYRALNPRAQFRAAQLAVIAANRLASSSSSDITDRGHERTTNVEDEPVRERRRFCGVDLPHSIAGWMFFPATFFWKFLFSILIVDCSIERFKRWWWVTFVTSILLISGISYLMVEAARLAGCLIGIPSAAMGLTVLAAGTSVPDALASISVARNGAGDMAVSNAIGSNVFDILLGLGFPWFIGAFAYKIKVPADRLGDVVIPVIILFVVLIILLVILIVTKWRLQPLLGYILFGLYALFVTWTLLNVFVFEIGSTAD